MKDNHPVDEQPLRADYDGAVPTTAAPGYEEIALLAYTYWQERGDGAGSAADDWFRAEATLLAGNPRQQRREDQ